MTRKDTMKNGLFGLGLWMVFGWTALAGCEQQEDAAKAMQVRVEKAELAVAAALKELAKVKADRDDFERLLNERSEELKTVKAEWENVQEDLLRRQQQIEQLRKERDNSNRASKEAARSTEGLQGQLREKTLQIQNLERINKDLQQTVQELTGQVQTLMEAANGSGVNSDANGT